MPEIFSATKQKSSKTQPPQRPEADAHVSAELPTDESMYPVSKHVVEEGVGAADDRAHLEVARRRMRQEDRKNRHVDDYSATMRQYRPTRNPFSAFATKPSSVSFDAQHKDEQVLLLLRQSLITQIKFVLVAIGLVFLPFLFQSIGLLDFLPAAYQFVATIGWYLVVLGYSIEVFLSWFYNVYIVTDERIIDVDFNSLLSKEVSYAKLDNIEDISAQTKGVLGSIFDYGDVVIQTAGTTPNFDFLSVPHPSKVVAFLNELLLEEEQEELDRRAY